MTDSLHAYSYLATYLTEQLRQLINRHHTFLVRDISWASQMQIPTVLVYKRIEQIVCLEGLYGVPPCEYDVDTNGPRVSE